MSQVSGVSAGVPNAADTAAASLLAQLQRLQQQLAESLKGASASTPEGKANADAIRAKISQVEQRIAQSDHVSERRETLLRAGKTEPVNSVAAESATVEQPRKTSGTGQIIDVFA